VAPAVLSNVLRCLRTAAAGSATVPDAELLARFAAGDAAAFELLLWRHGPMVYGVCRRVLRHEHDTEDAFQATFLALARKAGSVGRRGTVSGWLYRVAHRVALDARERAARRARREHTAAVLAAAPEPPDPAAAAAGRELWGALDGELERLPERCRVAFVLCCLEGRTVPEAARELGCAVKALESRLSRARARLRAGLARRGLVPCAGLTTAALAPGSSGGAVPAHLVTAALRTITLAAGPTATGAAVSANILALTQGVLRTMFLNKLKAVGAVLLAAGIVGAGAGGIGYRSWAAEGPGDSAPAQAQPEQGAPRNSVPVVEVAFQRVDDEVRQLKALMEQQKALADRLEALARRLEAQVPPGQRPPGPDPKPPPARTGAGGGPRAEPVPGDLAFPIAKQQRLGRLLDVMANALAQLKAAIPEADASWRERMVRKGYLAAAQAAAAQAGGPRRSVEAVESDLARLREELQQAGLVGAGAGLPAAPPAIGSVREVTPGGFVVLALTSSVRVGQTLHAAPSGGTNAGPASQLTGVAADGPEAVARAVGGRPQRGDRVFDAGVWTQDAIRRGQAPDSFDRPAPGRN
jgi:RNA polymerase sigma factor (sigma-70 family)